MSLIRLNGLTCVINRPIKVIISTSKQWVGSLPPPRGSLSSPQAVLLLCSLWLIGVESHQFYGATATPMNQILTYWLLLLQATLSVMLRLNSSSVPLPLLMATFIHLSPSCSRRAGCFGFSFCPFSSSLLCAI